MDKITQEEIDELKQRNAELEAQLVEVNNNRTGVAPCARFCEALAAKKMFDNLQTRNAELMANNNMLRTRLDDILEDMQLGLYLTEKECFTWKQRIKETLSVVPTQSLAERDREVSAKAGREGYLRGIDDWCEAEAFNENLNIEKSAEQYANKIKSGEVEV